MENGERIKMIKDITTLQVDMKHIYKQVSNHLPTAISDLSTDMKESYLAMNKRFSKLEVKIAGWGGGIAALLALLEIYLNTN
tara:strand:- start:2106 stop:2351 length:246 start_codon:yes stop_codon:yes gene_type:complete